MITTRTRLTIFLSLLLLSACINPETNRKETKLVTLTIHYGKAQPPRTMTTPLIKGQTVLALLQAAAEIETETIDAYIVVTSIDGVKSTRGKMAWYYKIDGTYADQLASNKTLHQETHIEWLYQVDTCSESMYD